MKNGRFQKAARTERTISLWRDRAGSGAQSSFRGHSGRTRFRHENTAGIRRSLRAQNASESARPVPRLFCAKLATSEARKRHETLPSSRRLDGFWRTGDLDVIKQEPIWGYLFQLERN